jgi:hypothetical protein
MPVTDLSRFELEAILARPAQSYSAEQEEARRELWRRNAQTRAAQAQRVGGEAIGNFLARQPVKSWNVGMHCETWEQWADCVRFVLRCPGRSRLSCSVWNNCSVSLQIQMAGPSAFTFWPPHEKSLGYGPLPRELEPLAWELAWALNHVGVDN